MKVSVIIPTWNRGHIIEKTIQSVLGQSVAELEVLVCDDGSTDGTAEKVAALGDPRIRWIAGEPSGRPAVPRNRGMKAARGEWLAFLDSDDEWKSDKLEKQLTLAEKTSLRAVSCNAIRFLPEEGPAGNYLQWKKERIGFEDLLQNNSVITSSMMIHQSLISKVSGFPEAKELKAIEDYALWLRVATQTDIGYLAEPLIVYRDDPKNSVRGDEKMDFWQQKRNVLNDFLLWAEKNGVSEEQLELARKALMQTQAETLKQPFFPGLFRLKRFLTEKIPALRRLKKNH